MNELHQVSTSTLKTYVHKCAEPKAIDFQGPLAFNPFWAFVPARRGTPPQAPRTPPSAGYLRWSGSP